jgi:MOSC domain-containing protein YiiM
MQPDQTPRVLSLNVGPVREVAWRGTLVHTAIWKSSVGDRALPLRGVNFEGDDQADRTVHGGADKAVYAYADEDYKHWESVEGIAVEPGLFGENLTLLGVDLRHAIAGERWRVGSTLLEVAQPRLPCYKLGIRMGDPHFLRRFMSVGRPGAYLRIIEEGEVRAGDAVHVVSRPDHGVTLRQMVESLGDPRRAAALLVVPGLPEFWRAQASRGSE